MADDDDLLAFDEIAHIINKGSSSQKPPATTKAGTPPTKTATKSENPPTPAPWVNVKKRPLPSDVQSPEGSVSNTLTPPPPAVIDLSSSPIRPHRKFQVASKPAAAAIAIVPAAASAVDPRVDKKKKQSAKTKKALFGLLKSQRDQAQLWIDRYLPITELDLAIFKKRITEFKEWLTRAQAERGGRLLILTGPAGAGKTAMVRVVGKEMGFEVSEWINPVKNAWTKAPGSGPQPSRAEQTEQQFRDFLLRTERYLPVIGMAKRRLILLEDLPFLQKAKEILTKLLQEHLKTNGFPIVLILSDAYLGSSSLHTVLAPDLLADKRVTRISVGSVAPGALFKVLQRIATAEGLKFTDDEIQKIANLAGGDLRHAINELQDAPLEKKSKKAKSKHKEKGAWKASEKEHFEDSQELIDVHTARDVSLSIFHAIGKIVHNKRPPLYGVDEASPAPTRQTRGPPESEPERVMHRIYVDPETWVSFLHENYGLMLHDVDEAALSLEYLSDADIIASRWQDSDALGGAVASIAARGIQYGSCHPTPERGLGKFASFYKPQQFQVRKRSNEIAHSIRGLFLESPEFGAFSDAKTLRTETLPYLRRIVTSLPYTRVTSPLGPPLSAASSTGGVTRAVSAAQRDLLNKMCSYSFLGRSQNGGMITEMLRPDDGIDSASPPLVVEGEKPELASESVRESKVVATFIDDIIEC